MNAKQRFKLEYRFARRSAPRYWQNFASPVCQVMCSRHRNDNPRSPRLHCKAWVNRIDVALRPQLFQEWLDIHQDGDTAGIDGYRDQDPICRYLAWRLGSPATSILVTESSVDIQVTERNAHKKGDALWDFYMHYYLCPDWVQRFIDLLSFVVGDDRYPEIKFHVAKKAFAIALSDRPVTYWSLEEYDQAA